jgi:N6-L-threonylcarbamoyladenine synthase
MRPSTRVLRAIRSLRVLGIESSADDSCAAVVDSSRRILSNVVMKQHDIHGESECPLTESGPDEHGSTAVKYGGIHPIKSQDAHAANLVGDE